MDINDYIKWLETKLKESLEGEAKAFTADGLPCRGIYDKMRELKSKQDQYNKQESKGLTITDLCKQSYDNAEKHGFWDDWDSIFYEDEIERNKESTLSLGAMKNNAIGNRLMLIVSEVAEAQDALRHNDMDNFKEELSDVVIRLGDLCGGLGIDLEAEILKKMETNKNRPYKHGKAF